MITTTLPHHLARLWNMVEGDLDATGTGSMDRGGGSTHCPWAQALWQSICRNCEDGAFPICPICPSMLHRHSPAHARHAAALHTQIKSSCSHGKLVSKQIPGRTDNAIKNRWHATLRRLIRRERNIARGKINPVLPYDPLEALMALRQLPSNVGVLERVVQVRASNRWSLSRSNVPWQSTEKDDARAVGRC